VLWHLFFRIEKTCYRLPATSGKTDFASGCAQEIKQLRQAQEQRD